MAIKFRQVMAMRALKETELYPPLKEFFVERGFSVRSEVRDCDLTAVMDDRLIIVELKTSFNLDLVLQGTERKRLCDEVYLAVPRPKDSHNSRWRKITRLCRALGLGLLFVSPTGLVDTICPPAAQAPRKSARKQQLLLREIDGRTGDYNIGGSRGRPLVTAYREQALRVAEFIGEGLQRPRDIVAAIGIAKAPAILQDNHYGWFERVERGVYRLSAQGSQALNEHADVLKNK